MMLSMLMTDDDQQTFTFHWFLVGYSGCHNIAESVIVSVISIKI